MFEPGHKKLGGRKKGTPNRIATEVSDLLEAEGFDLVKESMDLYRSSNDDEVRQRILNMLFPYVHSKRSELIITQKPLDEIDVTGKKLLLERSEAAVNLLKQEIAREEAQEENNQSHLEVPIPAK